MGGHESKLSPSDLKELSHQTNLTEEKIRNAYKDFVKTFPNERISKKELIKLYREYFPNGDPAPFAERMFHVFDSDKNGHIDFREFITRVSLLAHGPPDQRLRLVFQSYDFDGDGFITKTEFVEMYTAVHKALEPIGVHRLNADQDYIVLATVMFERMDKNVDGQVSFEEFSHATRSDSTFRLLLSYTLDTRLY